MSKSLLTLQMPSSPDPVPVVLDPATTALLIFDVIDHICARQPKCREQMVPAISSLLAQARKTGVTIVYGTRAPNMTTWLPEVSPASGDIKIENHGSGQILQYRSRQSTEGQRYHDAHSDGLESERIGDIYVGRSNAARLHRRCSNRRDVGRDRIRNNHRAVSDFESEQFECRKRAFED